MMTGLEALRKFRENKSRLVHWCPGMDIVNEERAAGIMFDGDPHKANDIYNQVIRRVGLSTEKLKPHFDPGIRPLVKRIADKVMIPIVSCSGHKFGRGGLEKKMVPRAIFLTGFGDPLFGLEFIRVVEAFFKDYPRKWRVLGQAIWMGVGADPHLTVEDSLQYGVAIRFEWEVGNLGDCADVWRTFSEVLDHFDHQGIYEPKLADLAFNSFGEMFDYELNRMKG